MKRDLASAESLLMPRRTRQRKRTERRPTHFNPLVEPYRAWVSHCAAFTLRRPFEPLDRLPDVVHFSNPDEAQTNFEDHAGRVADQPGK